MSTDCAYNALLCSILAYVGGDANNALLEFGWRISADVVHNALLYNKGRVSLISHPKCVVVCNVGLCT